MNDSLLFIVVAVMFVGLSILIVKYDRKPTYQLRYINGWFVIQHSQTQKHIKRFKSQEQAEIWFNENCKDV
jgi:hypothetical protein